MNAITQIAIRSFTVPGRVEGSGDTRWVQLPTFWHTEEMAGDGWELFRDGHTLGIYRTEEEVTEALKTHGPTRPMCRKALRALTGA